jgi:hypothetical protein
MAYRTGQNEYINKRRKELEALQEQRASRQQKSQMQVNDINAGFQQIQMQHQQGMQRAAAQNEFQLDRDQRNQDWNVKAAGDLFNNQKELNDQRHQQGLGRVEFGQDLQNQAMIANNQAQDMTETIDRLYGTSNQSGRDLINQFQAQQIKLRGHVTEGKITQEQYDTQYSEAKGTLVNSLTGKNSLVYQIGADLQVGGQSITQGGALKKVIGEGGAVIYQRNYGPEVEGEDKDKAWEEKYQQVQYNGPNDKIGYKNIYNMHTGEVTQQSMLPEWKAQNEVELKAIEFQEEQRRAAAQASTGADSIKSANEAVTQLVIAYESNARPRPEYDIGGGESADDVKVAQQIWDEGLLAYKKRHLTREQQVALGLIEPSEGQGVPRHLGETEAERARNDPNWQGLEPDLKALPPNIKGSEMAPEATDELDQFLMDQDTMEQGMGVPGQQQQPAPNDGAAFNNKLNFLESMNI